MTASQALAVVLEHLRESTMERQREEIERLRMQANDLRISGLEQLAGHFQVLRFLGIHSLSHRFFGC
eukprot:12431504-Karenia_brevis.AAC.1